MGMADRRKRWGRVVTPTLLVVATIAALGLIALAVAGVRGGGSPKDAGTLDRYAVSRRAFDMTTTASGELEARRQVEIRSKLQSASTLVEIVPEGTMVKAGDLLVRLNADALKDEIAEEELRVETARAELTAAREALAIQTSENDSAKAQAELAVTLAQLSLQQWKEGELKQQTQDLELAVETATREHDRLKVRFERSCLLEKEGFYSKDQLEKDSIELDRAKAELDKAVLAQQIYHTYQEPMDEEQRTSDLTEAQAELERVNRQNASYLASKQADLLNKQRQFDLRASKLSDLNEQLAASTITAPSDGLVVYSTSMERGGWRGGNEGPWQIGSEVHPNELIIILPDTTQMIASVRVHESLVSRIRPGQRANVEIDAIGRSLFYGEVLDIGVLAETGGWRDPNRREYTVRIALDTSGAEPTRLKPSMRCEAEVVMGRVEDALAVPIQAVFSEGPLQYVYIPDGAKFIKRPIKVGRRSEQMAEIAAGLQEGDLVLLRQPDAGEVRTREYMDEELASVGLERGKDGKLVRIADARKQADDRNQAPANPATHAQRPTPQQHAPEPEQAQTPAQPPPQAQTPAPDSPTQPSNGAAEPTRTVERDAPTAEAPAGS
jgi:multidrug efflux pump subunit AcrA (membrane-fusion protein)